MSVFCIFVFDSQLPELNLAFLTRDFFLKMPFQDHVKEKVRLVQDFLHVEAQDQLTSLEEKMKSSEISMVSDSLRHPYPGILLLIISPVTRDVCRVLSSGGLHL